MYGSGPAGRSTTSDARAVAGAVNPPATATRTSHARARRIRLALHPIAVDCHDPPAGRDVGQAPAVRRSHQRRNATSDHTPSTMPNGTVPARNPYAEDIAHVAANAR